ncbi:MAG: hypothetical protein KF862_25195 [Chitinophagaceae bacterium]|nr:hypothetical protein [Chitinophagaceae bacterium]
MKLLNVFLLGLVIVLFSAGCSKDKDPDPINETEGLQLVTTLSNDNHKVNIYTKSGKLQTGYNEIFFQVKDAGGNLVDNALQLEWMPVMHMSSMSHSCPASSISKKENTRSLYKGFVVFQMAGSDMEYWELTIDYSVGGTAYEAKGNIQVLEASKKVVQSFLGSDEKRYVLALVAPSEPKVAVNDMTAVLYRMESMMSFVPVDGYTVKIDPRMPGMGNHSSPNNIDLTQGTDKLYHGKLSLTMTGYWKINLQLENGSGTVVKGEPVTEGNEGSSIYFELEF